MWRKTQNNHTMSKTDFQTAINLIRGGEIDQGLELLEKATAPETIKNIAKAEIAYYRDDLKNAMYFDEHSLPADHQCTIHLSLTITCAHTFTPPKKLAV